MYFKGDIIITDPMYFITDPGDYERTEQGKELSLIGFTDYISVNVGDEYSYNAKIIGTDLSIGRFCTDSSMIAAVYADEVQKYNPGYIAGLDPTDGSALLIKGFSGDLVYDINRNLFANDGGPGFTACGE